MNTMTINSRSATLPDDPDALLIDVVRGDLNLTGTKLVCGAGVCGACTVLVDGAPVVSCLMPARAAASMCPSSWAMTQARMMPTNARSRGPLAEPWAPYSVQKMNRGRTKKVR